LLDFLGNLKRTHYCGELRAKDEGRDAIVMGWVAARPRDLGNLLFLDVRDRTGIVQVVFQQGTQPARTRKPSRRVANLSSLWKAKSQSARKPIRNWPAGSRVGRVEATYP